MRLKLCLPTTTTTSIQLLLQLSLSLLLLLNKVPRYHALNHLIQISDPLVITEIRQSFPSPFDERHANVTVPHKHLVFTLLLPDSQMDNMNDCIMPKVRPVLELAIPRIHQMGFAHNARIDITVISRDTNCSSVHGPLGFFEIYMQWPEINAVFGMSCNYVLAPIARYLGVWKIPAFTTSGSANNFADKTEFSTLTRMMGSQANIVSKAAKAILKTYNWRNVTMIYQNSNEGSKGNSVCYFCAMVLMDEMKLDSYYVNMGQQQIAADVWTKKYVRERLMTVMPKSRIVILCADPKSIRQIMIAAEELNMIDSGEYVFINIELFSKVSYLTSEPWYDETDTVENNARARKAYTAILTIAPKQPNDDKYIEVSNQIKAIAAAKYNYTFEKNEPISAFATSFYDSVLLYANALNDSIREDPTVLTRPINGTDMVRRMWNRSFTGITGNVTIDANGDRISAAYSLLDLNPETGKLDEVAYFSDNQFVYIPGKSIHWAGNRQEPPLNMPVCGFDGKLCPDNSLPGYAILSMVLGAVVVIMSICFFFGYRHYKSEAEINSMSWRVSVDDVIFHNSAGRCLRGSLHSLVKQNSQITLMSDDMGSLSGDRQIYIPVGLFRGCKVAVKSIAGRNIGLTRSLMLELKRMKDLQHDHLVKFYGACLDPAKSFILTEYCPKGSLQDILENDQFQLDWMFKLSLMHDIVRGIQFLHNSDIKSHGNLKSSNCVVDSRFVLKISDFGLHTLRKRQPDAESDVENANSHAYWSKLLWTAPELLKMGNDRPPEGTQKGDVYSFGIIVHEISTRQGPFYLGKLKDEKSPQEIIHLVKGYPHMVPQPFRPSLVDIPSDYKEINTVLQKCWSEDPTERPDINALKSIIRNINKDNETGHIVDNLLKRMEQYANNLEELVEERTQDYIEEKKKCEKLLYQLLPQSVAAQLISGQPVVAETFDQVTIYFSDIVGFTAISAESTPMQVVQFLNDLYTCFDSIVENFDVYKVETIGDAYMVVSGLPIRNGNQHAREIARLALALLQAVHNFQIHHRPSDRLKLRIGLHTGACVAGVVGLKMPRYCLFGDTVNTASRMESNGEALKIHISEKTKLALDEFGSFITTKRGFVPMKGKGEMLTYWLEGEVPKVESPLSPQKLMLSRRSSLKHVARYGVVHKQNSDVYQFMPPYYQNQPVDMERSASRQASPNLRVKRKISSSSPKLNGNDDFYNYLEASAKVDALNSMKLSPPPNDIYSSRSLRDDSKEAAWEMVNFRLPLSGTLKTHNNPKHSYTQLSSTQSNSNLSGVLQPTGSRLRLKNSPTISSLINNNSDTASVSSSTRIKFNINECPEETENLVTSNVYEDYERETEAEEIARITEERKLVKEIPINIQSRSATSTPPMNGDHYSQQPLINHSDAATVDDYNHYAIHRNQTPPNSLHPGANSINNILNNCNSTLSQQNNYVKANNCRNFNSFVAKNSSNSTEDDIDSKSPTISITDEGGTTTTGTTATGGVTSGTHHKHTHHSAPVAAVAVAVAAATTNTVTQPLLAKINS